MNKVYSFVVNRNLFKNELKMICDYADIVKTRVEDGWLNLKVSTNEQTFELKLDITSHEGDTLIQNFGIEIEDIKIEVSEVALRIYDDANETEFLLPRYGALEKEW